jgi:hypothetical protein
MSFKLHAEPYSCPNCDGRYRLVRAEGAPEGSKGRLSATAAGRCRDVRANLSLGILWPTIREAGQGVTREMAAAAAQDRHRSAGLLSQACHKVTVRLYLPPLTYPRIGGGTSSLSPGPSGWGLLLRSSESLYPVNADADL